MPEQLKAAIDVELTAIQLGSRTTNLANDRDAWPVSQTYPAGDEVDRSYTSSHATAGINTSAGYGSQTNRSQGLDTGDRIWRQILNATQGRQYSYDSLGRLRGDSDIQSSGVTCDPHTPPTEDGAPCTYDPSWFVSGQGWNYTFIYDSAGNRTDHGGTYAPGNRITAFNGCTYAADSDGNVASATCGAATVTYYWSAENRLDSLGQSGQTTTFAYDAAGRLVRQQIGTNSAHYLLWDGNNLLAELDSAGPSMVAEYSYYPGADNPHALIANGHKYYSHQDGLGNVIALTDSTAGLARTYGYWAWGESTGGGSDYAGLNGKDRARFKGALVLGPNGSSLYYMRARWYDAGMGRFLSEDPMGLQGGINPYVFARNDPVNGNDPTGLTQEAQLCPNGMPLIVDGEQIPCTQANLGALGEWLWSQGGLTLWDVLYGGFSGTVSDPSYGMLGDRAGASLLDGPEFFVYEVRSIKWQGCSDVVSDRVMSPTVHHFLGLFTWTDFTDVSYIFSGGAWVVPYTERYYSGSVTDIRGGVIFYKGSATGVATCVPVGDRLPGGVFTGVMMPMPGR